MPSGGPRGPQRGHGCSRWHRWGQLSHRKLPLPPTFPGSLGASGPEGLSLKEAAPATDTHSPRDHTTAQVPFTCSGLGDILRHPSLRPCRAKRSPWLSAGPAPGALRGSRAQVAGARGRSDPGLPCTFLLADGGGPTQQTGPLPATSLLPPSVITRRSLSVDHSLCRPSPQPAGAARPRHEALLAAASREARFPRGLPGSMTPPRASRPLPAPAPSPGRTPAQRPLVQHPGPHCHLQS